MEKYHEPLGMVAIVWAPVLLPMSVWLYTLVFAFSSLWFVHYCLASLHQYRLRQAVAPAAGIALPPAAAPTSLEL